MTRGCLIFAHDSTIDYGSQAVLAGSLAKKHLGCNVSLVADAQTIQSVNNKFVQLPFENIIEVDRPATTNQRLLAVDNSTKRETVSFINSNRASAYDITPYDRTLVIDSDFLIFSSELNKYWEDEHDFLINAGMLDLAENMDPAGYSVSINSIPMMWATNIMFSKTAETKILFDLVEAVKQEYLYFSQLYEFDPRQYRNDFAFSIACHVMSGHDSDQWQGILPPPVLIKDTDQIVSINKDRMVFLVKQISANTDWLINTVNQDIHLMNKRALLDNFNTLIEFAND